MATDWSQFAPVEDTPPHQVDWSQFAPVTAAPAPLAPGTPKPAPSLADTSLDYLKAAGKGVAQGGLGLVRNLVNLPLSGAAVIADKAASLATGKNYTGLEDAAFGKLVAPLDTMSSALAPAKDASAGQQVTQSLGAFLPDLAAMYLTGGESAVPKIEAEAPGTIQAIGDIFKNALAHSTRASALPAISHGAQTASDVQADTGNTAQALNAGATQALLMPFQNMAPLNAPGRLASRMAQGAAVGPLTQLAAEAPMNAVLPQNMQQHMTAQDAVSAALPSAIMAGVLGEGAAHAPEASHAVEKPEVQQPTPAAKPAPNKLADLEDALRRAGLEIPEPTPEAAPAPQPEPSIAPATENAAAPHSPAGTSSPERPIAQQWDALKPEARAVIAHQIGLSGNRAVEVAGQSWADLNPGWQALFEKRGLAPEPEPVTLAHTPEPAPPEDIAAPAPVPAPEPAAAPVEGDAFEREQADLTDIERQRAIEELRHANARFATTDHPEAFTIAQWMRRAQDAGVPKDAALAAMNHDDWTQRLTALMQEQAHGADQGTTNLSGEGRVEPDRQGQAAAVPAGERAQGAGSEGRADLFPDAGAREEVTAPEQARAADDTPEPPLDIRYGKKRVSSLLPPRKTGGALEDTGLEVTEHTPEDAPPEARELVERTRQQRESAQSDTAMREHLREASTSRGEAEANQRGLRGAVEDVLGTGHDVEFVRDVDGLPDDVRARLPASNGRKGTRTGLHDPESGRTFIFTDAVHTPEDAAWTAAHEVAGHKGFRALINDRAGFRIGDRTPTEALNKATDMALQNPTIAKLADVIGAQRKSGDRRTMAEEALAELSAATKTGDWQKIADRYGVDVPKAVREGVRGAVAKFVERLRRILHAIMGKTHFSDDQVHQLVADAGRYARGDAGEVGGAGLESVSDQTATPEFRRWFGDSKVVDAQGKPLVVYHGSADQIDAFRTGPSKRHGHGKQMPAIYFSPLRGTAEAYARTAVNAADRTKDGPGHITAAYLSIKSPAEFHTVESFAKADRTKLEAAGHDGAVRRDGFGDVIEIAAFHPEQIKSASGNRGTFDPDSPNILESVAPDEHAQPPKPDDVLPRSFVSKALSKLIPGGDDVASAVRMAVAPMAEGSVEARATAKDFANTMREARYQGIFADAQLTKHFDRQQLEKMWNAADEQSVLEQKGEPTASKGLATLTPEERRGVEILQANARKVFEQARALGMVEGEGLPSYTPRMVVRMGDTGPRPFPNKDNRISGNVGRNVRTTTPQMRQRLHLTAAETEAAAKAKLGEDAELVRNIRTLPLATSKLAEAVAGRSLINRIKEIGKQTGQDTVREGSAPDDGYKWFTIQHPAFTTWRPRFETDPESGKVTAVKDENGNTVFDRVPLYVRGDFAGPLKAVLSEKNGPIYNGLMALKGKTMSVIMYSPLIHNAVEWGRALPAMPGKVLTLRVYFEGNRAKNDPETMREAIKAGLVPIGHRYGFQDISSIQEGPNIIPGRSWTAKLLAVVPNLFDKRAGDAVKRAIDKAGDVYHNKLLWDRVADLQMGLYTNFRDHLTKKGFAPATAQKMAAHFANRYAGALPMESMSNAARKISNLLLFSRSFTLGNLGAMKDMVAGLPRDVQSQILRDGGLAELTRANAYSKRKAISIIAADMALMYLGNSLLQSGIAVARGQSTLSDEEKGYLDRLAKAFDHVKENPLALLHPFDMAESLTPMSRNEPGKEDRVLVGHAPDGTAIYMRNPTGKIGEEFKGWLTSPLDMLKRKMGTIARPLYEIFTNDKGFGRKVYDPYDDSTAGMIKNAGRIAGVFVQDQVPTQAITAVKNAIEGNGDTTTNILQAAGPLAGVTFSKGAPGGPAVGIAYKAKDEHEFAVSEAIPGIRDMIRKGDTEGAVVKMRGLGMPPSYIRWVIRTTNNPSLRLSPKGLRDFQRYASPEAQQQMRDALGADDGQ